MNPALQRAVEIAEWTREFYLRPDARAVAALRVPQDSDLRLLFPSSPPEAFPELTPEEQRRYALAPPDTVLPETLDLLFFDTDVQRAAMITGLPAEYRRSLLERGITTRAGNWTDRLAPEVRGMVMALREALPPRRFESPSPSSPPADRLDTVLEEMAESAADEAVVRVLHGDLSAAERALNDFGLSATRGRFMRAITLIRSWRGQEPVDSPTR